MRSLVSPPLSGVFFGLLIVATALSGCGTRDPVSRGQISAFGSTFGITLIGVNRHRAAEVTRLLETDIQQMEQAWHAWNHGPLSRMNALFNQDSEPFAAAPSVLPILKLSKQLSEQSDGLFNPSIGHLMKAWGFQGRAAECLRPPPADLIEQALSSGPSMRDIKIDGFRVSSSNQTVKLDFRAIQKGFAIDQAISRLQELGIDNASISVDGNLRAIGSRDGHPWNFAVRGAGGGGIFATLDISGNEAAFSAGVYRQDFAWEGEVYHDIIDPRTGFPAADTDSVTVLHPHASTADAAANALFVAGPEDWHRVAKKMGIRYVMLTDKQGRVHMNPAMQARVKLHRVGREIIISEPLT